MKFKQLITVKNLVLLLMALAEFLAKLKSENGEDINYERIEEEK